MRPICNEAPVDRQVERHPENRRVTQLKRRKVLVPGMRIACFALAASLALLVLSQTKARARGGAETQALGHQQRGGHALERGAPATIPDEYLAAAQANAPPAYDFANAFSEIGDARNPAQAFLVKFLPGGVRVTPEAGASVDRAAGVPAPRWFFELALSEVRRGGRAEPVGPARDAPHTARNRARFFHDSGIESWYVNGPLGLEHGYVLPVRPLAFPADDSELVLELDARGLTPTLDGLTISLRDDHGTAVLRYSGLSAMDARGTALRAQLGLVGGRILLQIDDALAHYPIFVDPLVWSQVQELPVTGSSDVAMSDDTILVASLVDASVHVFERSASNSETWVERKKISLATSAAAQHMSVALSGDTAVVGVRRDPPSDPDERAYVFERNLGGADNWGLRTELARTCGQVSSTCDFGQSVAISGDTVVVGSPGYTPNYNGYLEGRALRFDRNEGGADNWGLRAILSSSAGLFKGRSVAVSGETIIVAGLDSCSITSCKEGTLFVYEGASAQDAGAQGEWSETTRLPAAGNGPLFEDVAIDGNAIIASFRGGSPSRTGARVFVRDPASPGGWGERPEFVATEQPSLWVTVAMSGGAAILGVDGDALHIFGRDVGGADSWGLLQTLPRSSVRSVAMGADAAVVGTDQSAYVLGLKKGNGDSCSSGAECASSICESGTCKGATTTAASESESQSCIAAAPRPLAPHARYLLAGTALIMILRRRRSAGRVP